MSDISSYYNSSQKRYLYKKTVFQYNASGASGASGVSGMSGAAGASGASGVSGISGTSGSYVVVDVEVTKLTITEVINLFTTGNLKESEMETWLRKNTAVSGIKVERKGNVITYKFKYIGRQYSVSCTKAAAASQTDNITQEVKTEKELLQMGLNKNDISQYFIKVSNYGTEKYALKPGSIYKTISELVKVIKHQKTISNAALNNRIDLTLTTSGDKKTKLQESAKPKIEPEKQTQPPVFDISDLDYNKAFDGVSDNPKYDTYKNVTTAYKNGTSVSGQYSYVRTLANQLINGLKEQMLSKAKKMCAESGISFDSGVFNSIFENAKSVAITVGIPESASLEKMKKTGVAGMARKMAKATLNPKKLLKTFVNTFKDSYQKAVAQAYWNGNDFVNTFKDSYPKAVETKVSK